LTRTQALIATIDGCDFGSFPFEKEVTAKNAINLQSRRGASQLVKIRRNFPIALFIGRL
jgi:hypothetical protein